MAQLQDQMPEKPSASDANSVQSASQHTSVDSTGSTGGGKPKFSKKQLIIGGVIAIVLLIIAAPLAVYALWYNQPDKVVADAFGNSMSVKSVEAEGSYKVSGYEAPSLTTNFKLVSQDQDTAQVDLKMTSSDGFDTSGSMIMDGSTAYVKMNKIKEMMNYTSDMDGLAMMEYFDDIITKIDGKWISISDADLKKMSNDFGGQVSDNKQLECSQAVLKKFSTDSKMQNQISDLYQKNRFFVIKQTLANENVNGSDSNHYIMDVDQGKLKAFMLGMKDTDVFKALDGCSDDDLAQSLKDQADSTVEADPDMANTAEIWVDRWSHQLTKIKMTSKSKTTEAQNVFESTLKMNAASVKVDIPKDSITLSELVDDIVKSLQSMFSASLSSDYADYSDYSMYE